MKIAVLACLQGGKEKEFLDKVKEIPEVKKAVLVSGRFDALLEIEVADFAAAAGIVLGKIRTMPSVKKTETLIEVE